MVSTKQHYAADDEISIREIIESLWNGRWFIASFVMAFTFAAGIAAWSTPKTYKATITISPVSDSSSSQLSGLSGLASQFGGLAALAGVSVTGDSKKSESLAVLQSEALTETYIQKNNLLPVLYQNRWDAKNKKWKSANSTETPTMWQANILFKNSVRAVATDAKTGLVTLTISWNDPKIAAQWANDLVKMTNDFVRNKVIEQSERNIAYLNDQAAKTDAVGVQQAIYPILQAEINKVMLARGSNEYAFRVIDPAVTPEKPSSPLKRLWILVGMFSGFCISTLLVIARSALRSAHAG
jgi:uncharacterized protein involved in exopolysaccharide biosynthesis